MGYVIAIVLVILLVLGFATFLVMNASRRGSAGGDADDPGRDDNPLGIIGTDEGSPLGDTREHAGTQDREGHTVGEQDADAHGGTGRPAGGDYTGTSGVGESGGGERPEVARPVVGGEGEGERSV